MAETLWQTFSRHRKTGGFFYALKRGFKYVWWRNSCMRKGIDWKKFKR